MQNFAKNLGGLPSIGQEVASAYEILRALEQGDNENSNPNKNDDEKDFTSEIDHNAVIVNVSVVVNVDVPLFSST